MVKSKINLSSGSAYIYLPVILVVIFTLVFGYPYLQDYKINSYEECIKSPRSAILEMWPSKCITVFKKSFDMPVVTNNQGDLIIKSDPITGVKVKITTINSKVASPLNLKGEVPPGWMFEGVFAIKILDQDKNLITQGQGKEIIQGSWQSGNSVDFEANIPFSTSAKSGYLVLENDNPSGMPENFKSFAIPVQFTLNSNQSCAGIAGLHCPRGSYCKITENYPDASGICIRSN